MLSIIFFSVTLSNALVASSNNNSFGFLINALATPTLCLSPPLNLIPFSPIKVLIPSGSLLIISSTQLILIILSNSSSLTLLLANKIFSLIVALNKNVSWKTYDICFLKAHFEVFVTSLSNNLIFPS